MSDPVNGLGVTLKYKALESGAFPADMSSGATSLVIVDVTEMPKWSLAKKANQITDHSATTAHRFAPGKLGQWSPLKVKINTTETPFEALHTARGTAYGFQITLPDSRLYKIVGWISEIGESVKIDDIMTSDIEITVDTCVLA